MKTLFNKLLFQQEWQRIGRITSHSAILTLANIINALLMLLTIPYIIKAVGLAGYGIIVLVQAYTLTVSRFFDGQPWQVYIRTVGLGYAKSIALRIGLVLDAILLAGIILAALLATYFLAWWEQQIVSTEIAVLLVLSALNQCVFSSIGILRLDGKFTILATITILTAIFRLAAIAGVAELDQLTLRTIAWIYALAEVIRFTYTVWHSRTVIPRQRSSWQAVAEAWRHVRSFSFWNWLMNLVDLPVHYVDTLLIGPLLSVESVGVYGILKRVANVCSQIADPLTQVVFPEFTRLLAASQIKACQQLVKRFAVCMLGLGAITMAVLFSSKQWWLPWIGLSSAYTTELFLFMGLQIVAAAFTLIHPLMNAAGLARLGCYIILFSNLIFVLALYLLGSHYGLIGIIMALAIQYTIVIMSKRLSIKRHFGY